MNYIHNKALEYRYENKNKFYFVNLQTKNREMPQEN